MNGVAQPESRSATRVAGWSLIAAAIGFMGVFSYLAARFDYPQVLDGTAADVLPKLLALGDTGRAAWIVYALLPLLLIPAAVGAAAALGKFAPNAMRAAVVFGVIAASSMLLGLARWPTVHWELARAYSVAAPEARAAVDSVFAGLNLYLGNFIGEFLGELALNVFFILSGLALLRSGRKSFGYLGMLVGAIGLIAALRNVTVVVGPVAAANNYLLPAWLIAFGVMLVRWRSRTDS
jgi:hypothetical protein